MKTIRFFDGTTVPALGQGSWMIAEDPGLRGQEIAALREGVELGLTLIDTAEIYADGESERLVGEANAGIGDRVFLVSKAFWESQAAGPCGRRMLPAPSRSTFPIEKGGQTEVVSAWLFRRRYGYVHRQGAADVRRTRQLLRATERRPRQSQTC